MTALWFQYKYSSQANWNLKLSVDIILVSDMFQFIDPLEHEWAQIEYGLQIKAEGLISSHFMFWRQTQWDLVRSKNKGISLPAVTPLEESFVLDLIKLDTKIYICFQYVCSFWYCPFLLFFSAYEPISIHHFQLPSHSFLNNLTWIQSREPLWLPSSI